MREGIVVGGRSVEECGYGGKVVGEGEEIGDEVAERAIEM